MNFEPNERVLITDAAGSEHPGTATSYVERGDKFPIVWVLIDGETEPLPWPIESVCTVAEAYRDRMAKEAGA